MKKNNRLFAPRALTPSGWAENVSLAWSSEGTLIEVTTDSAQNGQPRAAGPVMPGMPNLHSHAFQRAMAGLTEYMAKPDDSFWSWRELM